MTGALILQISPHRDELAKLGSCRKPKADDCVSVKESRQGVAMVTRINKLLVANLIKTHRSTGVHIQKPASVKALHLHDRGIMYASSPPDLCHHRS